MNNATPAGHPAPNKFATALWFAVRPYTYPHLLVSDDIQDNVGFRDFAEIVGVDPVVAAWDGKFIDILEKPK